MKIVAIVAITASLYWCPWQLSGSGKYPHQPTIHSPIWEPPASARLRIEILAAEWIAIGWIWGIVAWGRNPKKEVQFDNEGNVID